MQGGSKNSAWVNCTEQSQGGFKILANEHPIAFDLCQIHLTTGTGCEVKPEKFLIHVGVKISSN